MSVGITVELRDSETQYVSVAYRDASVDASGPHVGASVTLGTQTTETGEIGLDANFHATTFDPPPVSIVPETEGPVMLATPPSSRATPARTDTLLRTPQTVSKQIAQASPEVQTTLRTEGLRWHREAESELSSRSTTPGKSFVLGSLSIEQ